MRQARRQRGHQDRRQPLAGSAQDELRAEGLALVPLEMLEVVDHQDPVARGDPEDGEEADQRAEREHAAADERRQRPADERHRQRQEGQRREPPAPERGLQEQEDRERGAERRRSAGGAAPPAAPCTRPAARRGSRAGSSISSRPSSISSRDRAEVAPAHVGADLDAAREVLALDRVRRRRDRARRPPRPAAPARRSGVSIGSSLDARQAVAGLGRAPHVHVVGPARPEDVADLLARDPGGRRRGGRRRA